MHRAYGFGRVSRIVESLAPARLGGRFRWLLASSWVSNFGDGIAIAAGPLLVASQTQDEFLVALAALVQWLPPLVFGLYAGALADRLDRRLLVVTVDLVRAAVVMLLAVAIATGSVSVGLVLGALFLLATGEVFADTTTQTLLPMVVERDDLAVGNARLQTGFVTLNQLARAANRGAAVRGRRRIAVRDAGGGDRARRPARVADRTARRMAAATPGSRPLHQDIAEGFRWVRHHPAVRTLVLTIFTFNITWGAAWSVLVLYATRRLGLGEVGFGLVTAATAAGGLLGTAAYGSITRRLSLADIMRIGLILETFTHLALALTTVPAVAMVIFFLFGAHAFVWGTTSITVRQRAVPSALQGRVGSVNMVGVFGGLVVGSALGGLLARTWGVTAPFWFAFVGSAIFVVLIWRQLSHIAHADDAAEPASA